MLAKKRPGKPDTGKPSVRFDEGSESDGHWPCLSIRRLRPTLPNGAFPIAATNPPLYEMRVIRSVLGRSKHRAFRRVRFHWGSIAFQDCCARGRAHSAEAISRHHCVSTRNRCLAIDNAPPASR